MFENYLYCYNCGGEYDIENEYKARENLLCPHCRGGYLFLITENNFVMIKKSITT